MQWEYEDLPDGMTSDQVRAVLEHFFREDASDESGDCFRRLSEIADRQWHSYSQQDETMKQMIEQWIRAHWSDVNEYLEFVMGVCYSFGLSKALFESAFRKYSGDGRFEYAEMLEHSSGESIDPYWSLREVRGQV